MPTSPAADITKGLRQAVKEENIPQLRKLLLDPQLLYITYISAFSAPLEKAVKKGNISLVQIIVEAIKKRYQQDYSPEAAGVINKVIQLEMTPSHLVILKNLYNARASMPVHQKCDLNALRIAALGGHQEAIEVILGANHHTPLPGDRLLLEEAVDITVKRSLLAVKQGILLSPIARQAATEHPSAGGEPAYPAAVVAIPSPLPAVTPTKPAAAIEPHQTVMPTLDHNASDTMMKMMQMMQAMMQSPSPELSVSRAADSTSGEALPATPITQPPL